MVGGLIAGLSESKGGSLDVNRRVTRSMVSLGRWVLIELKGVTFFK